MGLLLSRPSSLSAICSFLARTDPADVARVEGRTFTVTKEKYASVPHVKEGVKGILGQWMGEEDARWESQKRLTGCMKGERSSSVIVDLYYYIAAPNDSM